MQEKRINFYSPNLEKNYRDFLEKRLDIQELESDYEKRIAFAGSLLFDYNGSSDISRDGNGIEIGNFVQKDLPIDLIWYDSKSDQNKITFLKYFDISSKDYDHNGSDILKNYLKPEIENTIDYYFSIINNWKKYKKDENINFNDEKIKNNIEEINSIIEQIDNDELFYDDGKVKWTLINFSLIFVFSDLNKWKENLLKQVDELKKNSSFYDKKYATFPILFESDLETEYSKIIENRLSVESDSLKIDKPNNILFYESSDKEKIEKAAIVNVSAKSLHQTWKKYETNLLGLNLRYHIKNDDVDNSVKNSMNPEISDKFWFKNNGLVIICSNFEIKNDELILENFSIVNGGQTTTNIGKNKDLSQESFKDFFVAAKIISVKNLFYNENQEIDDEINKTVNEIAEATNKQKQIKKEDLFVHKSSIKRVKKLLDINGNNEIIMTIKRGEKNNHNKNKLVINYSVLIQISLAFDSLVPGSSRSNKNKIITSNNIDEVFSQIIPNNVRAYIDLIKFNKVLNTIGTKKYNWKKLNLNNLQIKEYQEFTNYCKLFSISIVRILKIFLNFPESINEYNDIIETIKQKSKDLNDEKQKIKNWSIKWWNKFKNPAIFKNNDTESIKTFWISLLKRFGYYFKETCESYGKDGQNTSKNDKAFYFYFIQHIMREFNDYQDLYKENIVVEEIDGSLNE